MSDVNDSLHATRNTGGTIPRSIGVTYNASEALVVTLPISHCLSPALPGAVTLGVPGTTSFLSDMSANFTNSNNGNTHLGACLTGTPEMTATNGGFVTFTGVTVSASYYMRGTADIDSCASESPIWIRDCVTQAITATWTTTTGNQVTSAGGAGTLFVRTSIDANSVMTSVSNHVPLFQVNLIEFFFLVFVNVKYLGLTGNLNNYNAANGRMGGAMDTTTAVTLVFVPLIAS